MTYNVEQHIALGRVSSIAASPDGRWLAVAVQRLDRDGAKYVSHLWRVPTDGGPAVQLTRGESKDQSPCFRHDGALGFLSNRKPVEFKADDEADKRFQIWILPAAGGEPQQLTDEPLGILAFQFAARADRLVTLAPVLADVAHDAQRETAAKRAKHGPSARRYTQQPVRHWDHWLHENADLAYPHLIAYRADGSDRVDLAPAARREFAIEPSFDLAEDGRRVVITSQKMGRDRELDSTLAVIALPAEGQPAVAVAPSIFGALPAVNHDTPLLSPDGTQIAVIRSIRSAKNVVRPTLTLIDIAGGSERQLGTSWDRWPILGAWSRDGKTIYLTADDEGQTPIFAIDVAADRVTRLTAPAAGGTHGDLTVLADGRLASIRSSLRSPPECVVVDVAATSASRQLAPRPLAPLSGFESVWPANASIVVESARVTSTDDTPIHYLIVKSADAKGRLPTLLWIHGGPIGMSGDGWHWRWCPLLAAAEGYAVVLPNPRGSTGFGQAFIQGIWGNCWGEQCYADIIAVTDAVALRADVDGARMMAMGGSFGGYMTNWIGTQTDRFKCLITHASIVTMAQFTGTTDHPGWWYLEMGGENPYADRNAFDRNAPISQISKWKTPTLIIHGELDYRCPIGEGLNLFEALQYHGVPSELLIFPDENHWILKPKNIVAWYTAVLEFIGRHLK